MVTTDKKLPSVLSSLIGKLETTPVDLNKLRDVVKNEMVKKSEYNELVKKINAIQTTDTSNLVKKTDYDTKSLGNWKKKQKRCWGFFLKKFYDKLKNVNKKVTSNKTKHI